MFNFNNKKQLQNFNFSHHCLDSPQFQYNQQKLDTNKQINATECLLLLSELEQNVDHQEKKFRLDRPGLQVEVTPWVNSNFNIKQKTKRRPCKSKTNIISQSCDQEIKFVSKNRQRNKLSEDQKNRNIATSNKSNRLKILKRQSRELKNSYSAIARYSDNCEASSQVYIYEKKDRINHLNSTKSPLCQTPQLGSNKHSKRSDKQNFPEQIILPLQNKGEDNINKIKIRKEQKYKNSLTQSINNYNKRVLSSAGNKISGLNTEESQFLEVSTGQYLIQNKKNHEKPLFREQSNQKIQQVTNCRLQFQNLIEGIGKTSQYQKIKNKILENIKKQSIIQSDTRMDLCMSVNKSKKLIGRYFKQAQQKKLKVSQKTCIGNTNFNNQTCSNSIKIGGCHKNSQIFDTGMYQLNNPISKNLYQKYKILLNKGK